MSKRNSKATVNVVLAGFNFAGAQADAAQIIHAAIKKEGRDEKAVRAEFVIGVMSRQLKCTTVQAQAAFEASGTDSKAQADKRRTAEQEKAYAAGRQAWSRVARIAGVVADKRGGARPKVEKAGKTEKAGKAGKQIVANPKVASAADAARHVLNMAMMISSFVKKNEAVVNADLSSLVADFVGKVSALSK